MAVKRAKIGSSRTQKGTRFASPSPGAGSSTSLERDEDNLLEEDLPEGAANIRAKTKRQVKDRDGYGSDSSNDEEGVVPSRRAGTKDEDEDMDMFAEEVDDKAKDTGKGKGKDEEFMDLEEIEGQEFERRRMGTEDDSGSEGEMDDRKVRKKEKEADLGFEVTPFNMKSEMDEGRFTANGESYVANDRDPGEKHDMWLEDLDKEEIRKARRAHREREKAEREKEDKEEGGGDGKGKERENDLMIEAVGLMERGETVLETLQRLGKEVEEKRKREEAGQKKKSWAERQKERKAAMAVEQEQADSIHTSNPFTNLSNIVSALTAIGHLDVYSLSRESLQRMLPAPPTNGSSSTANRVSPPPRDNSQYQYRFSMKYVRALPEAQRPVERDVFGPFAVQQLQQWRGTGFFGGPSCENVELRKAPTAGEEATAWGDWSAVFGS